VWLALGLGVTAAFLAAPPGTARDVLYNLGGLAAAWAIVAGIRMWRPARLRPWALLAAGVGLLGLADMSWTLLRDGEGVVPFPSGIDVVYLIGYVITALGLFDLVRSGNSALDRAVSLDALIVATGMAIPVWMVLVREAVSSAWDLPSALVAAAYPIIGAIQVALVAHVLLRGCRTPALALLTAGFVAWLVADLGYAVAAVEGTYHGGSLLDVGWLAGYVALATAGLHPSMAAPARRPDRDDPPRSTLTRPRLAILAASATIGPFVVLVQVARGESPDVLTALIGQCALSLLVLGRVSLGMTALHEAFHQRTSMALELEERATTDVLTGLANRSHFLARLEEAVEHAFPGRPAAVIYLDLDRMKAINDGEGHAAGDEALRVIGERLRAGLRSADVVARLGGDEFGVLLASTTERDALAVASRVGGLLSEPINIGDRAVQVGASVGVAIARPGDAALQLLRNADQAMYRAKAAGGGSCVLFTDEMLEEAAQRLQLRADLAVAVERGELLLHYQPIVDLRSGTIVGLEALLRWRHPARGLLLPGQFIGLAEETGLIVPIGRWVLREVVRQTSSWQREGLLRRPIVIDVNVAARQLEDARFAHDVAAAISGTGMGAGRIAIELTETELIRDPETVGRRLATLRRGGLQVVIDDFGTGYASMSYLVSLPVDGLKIDRQFVHQLEFGAGPGWALVSSMVGLARQLGIRAVAEGVETESQARALREIGCAHAQGFLFSPPVPPDRVPPLLRCGAIGTGVGAAVHLRRRLAAS
jgi:diguanylate cyclase (GGDEF)-like protein